MASHAPVLTALLGRTTRLATVEAAYDADALWRLPGPIAWTFRDVALPTGGLAAALTTCLVECTSRLDLSTAAPQALSNTALRSRSRNLLKNNF